MGGSEQARQAGYGGSGVSVAGRACGRWATLTVPVSSWSATPSCSSRRWCRISTTGSVAPPKSSGHRFRIHGSNDGTRNERDYPVHLVTSYVRCNSMEFELPEDHGIIRLP